MLYSFNFIIVGKLKFPNFQKITHKWDFKKVNPGGTVANNTKTTGPMLERSLQLQLSWFCKFLDLGCRRSKHCCSLYCNL